MDNEEDQTPVKLFISRKAPEIRRTIISGLRHAGFRVVVAPGNQILIWYKDKSATLNLGGLFRELATNQHGGFDRRLANPVYEATKIALVVASWLKIIIVYCHTENEAERMEKLAKLSPDRSIYIYREVQEGNHGREPSRTR